MHDVTARKSAEAEVLRIGEEERRRIAADLHDGVLQELAGIAYLTASVRADFETGAETTPVARLRRIEEAIVQAIDHTRQVACAMDPMLPGGSGLVGALRQFTAAIQATYPVRCMLDLPGRPITIEDPRAANQLYRIAQEAIRNAVRHAKARQVVVQLEDDGAALRLTVLDDGCGMPPDPLVGLGMGLHVIRYRARLVGGELTIRNRRDGGTEVTCRCSRPTDDV